MRRAQGIGINIVIIAAIALLVLVIVALIVSGGARNLSEGTKSCEAKGGKCDYIRPGDGWTQDKSVTCPGQETCWVYAFG